MTGEAAAPDRSRPPRRGALRRFGRPLAEGVTVDDLVLSRADRERMPFVLNTAEIAVDARLPLHSHHEWEIWVITSGGGSLRRGDETLEVATGDVLLFEPDTEHQLSNTSAEPLRLVSVYWP